MSKDMKLIMESFRGFTKEIQNEAGMSDPDIPMSVSDGGINEEGYVVAIALQQIEHEGGSAFSAKSQAKKLLAMDEQEIKRQLEPYLYSKADRGALANLSKDDLDAELRYIAAGSRQITQPKKIAPNIQPQPKKIAPYIPPDQPPANPFPR